jgi:hypothetical protein
MFSLEHVLSARDRRMRLTSVIPATAVLLLASCNPLAYDCTLMACQDGLNVRFDRAPAGAYRVEAFAGDSPNPQVFDCTDATMCPTATFSGLVADRVTIRVTTAGATYTQEFSPRYETVYPNGRKCGGRCSQATVTVQL